MVGKAEQKRSRTENDRFFTLIKIYQHLIFSTENNIKSPQELV